MLSDVKLRALKPRKTLYRVADGDGLCIEVTPGGSKLWRFRYRHLGQARMIALGAYPEVSRVEARKRLAKERALLGQGLDPSAERRAEKRRAMTSAANSFGAVAAEWLTKFRGNKSDSTVAKAEWHLGMLADLNARPITEITAPEVLQALRKIEDAGTHDTARRVRGRASEVFRYAIVTGRAERDPAADLRGALTIPTATPRAAVTHPDDVAGLLRAIDGYTGQPATHAALRLAPLLFARPGNLRAMEWSELRLDAAEWRIPAGKMKMREAHVVPLATQAVAILQALQPLTGRSRFVFPSLRTGSRPMSENTINAALRRLGFDKHTMTGHGFRALASTRLNEMGWAPDLIERQLAHAPRNKVRAAYNRAQYLSERKKMMQAWADYLDALKAGSNVVALRPKESGASR